MTSPVSPSETIAKTMEGKNRVQGMVRSIDQYRNCDPKAIADGSYAQILYALTDDKHDVLVLWDFAVEAARQAEALEREMAAKDERIAALEAGVSDLVEIARQHVPSMPPDGPTNAEHQAAYEATGFTLVALRKRARTLIQGEKP